MKCRREAEGADERAVVILAAALEGGLDLKGKTVAIVASGGNVDPAMFARALSAAAL